MPTPTLIVDLLQIQQNSRVIIQSRLTSQLKNKKKSLKILFSNTCGGILTKIYYLIVPNFAAP